MSPSMGQEGRVLEVDDFDYRPSSLATALSMLNSLSTFFLTRYFLSLPRSLVQLPSLSIALSLE